MAINGLYMECCCTTGYVNVEVDLIITHIAPFI